MLPDDWPRYTHSIFLFLANSAIRSWLKVDLPEPSQPTTAMTFFNEVEEGPAFVIAKI
jgi:hypothetical protein